MRTLTAALEQAQKAASRRPYVEVKVRDYVANAPRPRWTRLYTGSEPDEAHCAAVPEDGSLVRLRIGDGGGTTLFRQRVASPDADSDYTSWTSWRTGSRLCAVAQYGPNILAFTVDDATPTTIYKSESSDNGATWGAWAAHAVAAGTVTALAAASKTNGDTVLFFVVGATVYRYKRTSGVWGGGLVAWTNTAATVTGIAADYEQDWNLIITGTETTTTNPTVWQCVYGDGFGATVDTFSALGAITPTSAGANVVFDSPFIAPVNTINFIAYTESYSGTGGYNRPWWSNGQPLAFVDNLWREPVPFNQTANFGIALAYSSPNLWATTPFGVWYADVAAAQLDLSAALLAFRLQQHPDAAHATIELDNSTGNYNTPGAGTIAQIRQLTEVQINPGYRIPSAAPAAVSGIRFYIDSWEHTFAPNDQRFIIHCIGIWELLDHTTFRSSKQVAASALNVFQIAAHILARAGLATTATTSSSAYVNLYPAFTIHPGESAARALRRLFDKVEDRIRQETGNAETIYPQSSDTQDYAYGGAPGANHTILQGRVLTRSQSTNYVQTLAGTVLGESVDWTSVLDLFARTTIDQDKTLTTEAEADASTAATLRKAQMETTTGAITIPTNVAQELYDVVAITEPRLGLADTLRRVMAIDWHYDKHRAVYEQTLTLGAV